MTFKIAGGQLAVVVVAQQNRGHPLADVTGNDDAYLGGRGRLPERDQRDSVSSGGASRYQIDVHPCLLPEGEGDHLFRASLVGNT